MAGNSLNVAQLMAVLGLNTLPFEAQAAKASAMMKPGGMLFMGMAGLGVIAAGTGIIATKMAGDFQQGMTTIVTGAGEAASAIPQLSAGVLQLAKDTGTSTKQLTDGLYMIESGGFRLNTPIKALDLLRAAAEGAKVGNADLGTVADATDTILKNFGENGALTANQAVNTLIDTVAHGKTHMEDLASALAMVLPTGAAAGLGLNDVMAAMATMTSIGVPAAESATYLRQTIVALMAPSAGARKALADIGLTAKQVADSMSEKHGGSMPMALQLIEDHLTKKFPKGSAGYLAAIREISGGSRQMQGMLDLTGDHLKTFYDNWYRLGVTMTGTSNKVTGWELVQKNLNQQFDRFKETLSTLMIQLGTQLLPVATALFKFLADVALPAVKNLASWLGDKLGGAAAGIAQGWKDLTSKGGLLYGLMQQLPTILAAVHHYFDLLGQVWRTQIQPTLIQILPTLKVLGIILGVVILGVLASVVIMFLAVAGVITGVIFVVLKLVQGIQWVVQHFGDLGKILGWFFGQTGQYIGATLGAIGNFVGGVIGWFGNLQKSVEKKAHDLVDGVLTWFITLGVNAMKNFMQLQHNLMQWGHDTAKKVIDTLTGLPGRFLQLGKDIMHSLANGIGNAAGAVGNALKNVPGIGGMLGGLSKIIPKFAAQGGVFGDGEWGVVGERGPETLQMRGGRAIITPLTGGGIAASPAGSFMAGGGAGGNGQPLVIQVNIDGRKAAQAIVPHMPGVIRTATGRRNI